MDAGLKSLLLECLRFSIWAAGQGISPVASEDGVRSPEDFLFEFSQRHDIDDWDTLPDLVSGR